MIGAALSPAIRRHHPPTELLVGASPFDGSLVESTISHSEEMAEKILQMMAEDNAEEGDGGDSE